MSLALPTLKNILFLDIETVAYSASYEELADPYKHLWDKKMVTLSQGDAKPTHELFIEKAAIYAEFGKIVAIGLGMFQYNANNELALHLKALYDHQEASLLKQFQHFLTNHFPNNELRLCAHNGKEFDFPFLCRRMLVNGIPLPPVLDTNGKKPWEVNHLDTMELWKFGDRKKFTSLHLLATLFGITSSKELMDGSQVHAYYYYKKDLASIAQYCMQDVLTTVQVFLKLNSLQAIKEENIVFN